MSADLSVSGRIYRDGKLVKGTLHIDTRTGIIEKIARTARLSEHIDFGDQAILPGAIDIHVHFREPGMTHKEDLTTGSTAAAFGGVTTFVDMPNTAPPTTSLKALDEKLALAAEKSVVDYGFWSGATWYLGDLPDMLKRSVGVKIYLGATTGDLLMDDMDRVKEVLGVVGKAGKPVAIHGEAQRVLSQFRATEQRLADHSSSRPPVAEVEAIYDVMKALPGLAKPPAIHVAHAASVEALHAAKAAKFSAGVCPHHLLLDIEACCHEMETKGKMNPPLRDPHAREGLWNAFAAGEIKILESDHAPHTVAEKSEPFHQAPAGIPGVETMVPVMLAAARSAGLDIATVVDAVSTAPAALLGLKDRGALEPGMKADFAVHDLDKVRPVRGEALHGKTKWTPFEGMDAHFPSHVFLAGKVVVDDGELVGKPGGGQSIVET